MILQKALFIQGFLFFNVTFPLYSILQLGLFIKSAFLLKVKTKKHLFYRILKFYVNLNIKKICVF